MYAKTPKLMKWNGDASKRPLSLKKSTALSVMPAVPLSYPVIYGAHVWGHRRGKRVTRVSVCHATTLGCDSSETTTPW